MAAYEIIDREGRGGKIFVGDGTKIARYVTIDKSANVFIGKRVVISEGAMILTRELAKYDPHNREKISVSDLTIEDDVFIGTRAIIMAHVNRIGEKAVIGAGAVVTRDVDANIVVAGNPAKCIGVNK